jgi:hypothetical protein
MADRHETEHKSAREFPNGHAEILQVGGGDVGRLVLQPGWRWSNDAKPIAQTIISLPSGHDAWVVGDEPAIVVDWYWPAIMRRPADMAGATPASPRGRTYPRSPR